MSPVFGAAHKSSCFLSQVRWFGFSCLKHGVTWSCRNARCCDCWTMHGSSVMPGFSAWQVPVTKQHYCCSLGEERIEASMFDELCKQDKSKVLLERMAWEDYFFLPPIVNKRLLNKMFGDKQVSYWCKSAAHLAKCCKYPLYYQLIVY